MQFNGVDEKQWQACGWWVNGAGEDHVGNAGRESSTPSEPSGSEYGECENTNGCTPILAMNMLYFLAAGAEGVVKRTAETAPKGAIVIERPFGANSWSIFPSSAIAANAPAEGQRMSLREGVEADLRGFQSSHREGEGEATSLDATIPCGCLLLLAK